MSVYEEAIENKAELVKVRRHLHQYPEVSMKEFQTAEYIRKYLDEHGISWEKAGETGTVALVRGRCEDCAGRHRCPGDGGVE